MVQRRRFHSTSAADLAGLPTAADASGYQIINAIFAGAGTAALALSDAGLPAWLLAGLHAGGAVLIVTTAADLVLDYGGAWVADVAARINLRFNDQLQPAPPREEVRFVRVHDFGAPAPKTQAPVEVSAFDRADLVAFVEYGARVKSFSRRTFLPERGPHFTLPSGGQFGRMHYDRFRDELKRLGILTPAGTLALDLADAVGRLGGPVGGRAMPPARASDT